MSSDTLVVRRADFSIEDPWATPQQCDPVRLRRATDGTVPRLATTVTAYCDDSYLTIVFSAADDHVAATHRAHDAPLYDEDVVEVFLAPGPPSEYFELEVNPLGTTFDARIESPEGVRGAAMRSEVGWTCEGLVTAVRTMVELDGAISVDTLMRIPFAALGYATPKAGDSWRANFFRIDRHPSGDEYSAWQPTLREPADFHVVSAFGVLAFDV